MCSALAKNARSRFERFLFAHICRCCSGRQISYRRLFFPGSENVVCPFPDSVPQRWGTALCPFHTGLSAPPPSGTPEGRTQRRVLFEGRPSLPNHGRILAPFSQCGQDLGRTAGPGNPTPVMSWQIQTAQAAPKVRHGKQTREKEVAESLSKVTQACLPPTSAGERQQKADWWLEDIC